MMRMLMLLGFGAAMFAASAGASWYLRNREAASSQGGHGDVAHQDGHGGAGDGHESADAVHGGDKHGGSEDASAGAEAHASAGAHGGTQHAGHGGAALQGVSGQETAGKGAGSRPAGAADSARDDEAAAAAARPRPVSVEELLRYSLGLRNREEVIARREQALERKQSQLSLVMADLQGEQQELDGLRTQLQDQLRAAEQVLLQAQQERQQVEQLQQQQQPSGGAGSPGDAAAEAEAAQRDNIRRMSQWFQSMPPEKASVILKELANDGKLDLAVQLLSNFEEREASKILAALDDTTLTVEIAEAFRTFKRPGKPPAARR